MVTKDTSEKHKTENTQSDKKGDLSISPKLFMKQTLKEMFKKNKSVRESISVKSRGSFKIGSERS
jgi:hypothetical protein